MNKWILGFFAFCIVLLAGIYILIPSRLSISKITIINCTINGANRIIMEENNWRAWWPGNHSGLVDKAHSDRFFYNEYGFLVSGFLKNSITVLLSRNNIERKSHINILPVNRDSTAIQWQCTLISGMNPFKRISHYREAIHIRKTMAAILNNLQSFLENRTNIYGIDIHEIISKDSTLITIKSITSVYPGTSDIYRLIDTLKNYISLQNARQTNYPMLNIKSINDTQFEIMVALPVNKMLAGAGAIFPSRFVPWKTLTGTVRGGIYKVDRGFKQMGVFVEDYQRSAMALPFQSLVTDRSAEQDTLKWITLICQPVS